MKNRSQRYDKIDLGLDMDTNIVNIKCHSMKMLNMYQATPKQHLKLNSLGVYLVY